MSAGEGIADQIRTSEELEAAIEIAFEQIVQVKGLSGTHREYAVCGPPGSKSVPRLEFGELISVSPAQVLALIEIRTCLLHVRTEAIVRLRGVGHEVQAVAGIVNGVRPAVVHHGAQPMPVAEA